MSVNETINVKAWAIHSKDEDELKPFEYKLEASTMKNHDVDVEIINSGLCHTDWHMMKNDWGATNYPLVPGHEGIGKVVRVGKSVSQVAIGDVVGVGWIADSCIACNNCKTGNENLCGYTGLIIGKYGCFASHVRLNERFATKIPQTMDINSAGPLFCAGTTVFAPIKRYLTKPGQRIGIVGIGGLGHLAVRYASKMGAEVTAISRSRDREEYFNELGAKHTIATNEADAFEKNSASLDLMLVCAPHALDWEKYAGLLKTGGILILCGLPAATEENFNMSYNSIIFRQITIAGSVVAGSVDAQEAIHCADLYGIAPSVEVLPMDQVNVAIQRMLKGDFKEGVFRFVLQN